MNSIRKIWMIIALFSPLMQIVSIVNAQDNYQERSMLIEGTWNLDSMEINTEMLPEALVNKIMEKLQENKKYTTYYFGKDGKYISTTINKTTEGTWNLSGSGDTLTFTLPDKTINNIILKLDTHTLIVEPLGKTGGGENGKIFMIKPEE